MVERTVAWSNVNEAGACPAPGGTDVSNELVAALIGALVGGLASGVAALGGSVVVNRIQLKKATRLRMYDEVLPQVARPFGVLQDQFTTKADPLAPPEFLSLVDNLERLSVIAGGKDRQLAGDIRRLVYRRQGFIDTERGDEWEYYLPTGDRKWLGDPEALVGLDQEIRRAIQRLSKYLADKV
jgi:hypothetical protein